MDYAFTAEMEEVLDQIADGNAERLAVLTDFYFGDADGSDGSVTEGLQRLVSELGEIDARKLSTFPIGDLETTSTVRDRGPGRPLRHLRRGRGGSPGQRRR